MSARGDVVRALDDVPPVGLGQLVEDAARQSRVDRKYVLSRPEALGVLAALPRRARVLEIGGRRDLAYRSVYFDTDDLRSYHLAAHRRRRRFKVRTRTYLDTGTHWLEVKTRAARGTTVKQRIEHHHDPATLGSGRGFVTRTLRAERIDDAERLVLGAGLVTEYYRTTLLLPEARGAARATFDTGLVWSYGTATRALGDRVIVETKSGTAPTGLDRLLWRLGHRPERISKYGAGLALLRPDLPRGPWSRVIRRHLGVDRPEAPARSAARPLGDAGCASLTDRAARPRVSP